MYQLLVENDIPSLVTEFGISGRLFQIVLADASHYSTIQSLAGVEFDIIDKSVGKVTINLSNQEKIFSVLELLLTSGFINKKTADSIQCALTQEMNKSALTVASTSNSVLTPIKRPLPRKKNKDFNKKWFFPRTPVRAKIQPNNKKDDINNNSAIVATNLTDIAEPDFVAFFQKILTRDLSPIPSDPYDTGYDGPSLNPSLKIFGHGNKIDQGRWEIFVILLDEEGNLGFRSGVKGHSVDSCNLYITLQYDGKLFTNAAQSALIRKLTNYRWGHPSLALDTKKLEKDEYHLLPIFSGGWLIRNDRDGIKRIQVMWRSGRYSLNADAPQPQLKLLELYTVYRLTAEYGNDFTVEFLKYNETDFSSYLYGEASGGRRYTYPQLCQEVAALIEKEKQMTLDSGGNWGSVAQIKF